MEEACPHAALREHGRKLDSCAPASGATVVVSEHGCPCNGKSNPHGYGAYCKRWEIPTQRPWCYVDVSCPSPHPVGDYGRFDECRVDEGEGGGAMGGGGMGPGGMGPGGGMDPGGMGAGGGMATSESAPLVEALLRWKARSRGVLEASHLLQRAPSYWTTRTLDGQRIAGAPIGVSRGPGPISGQAP